MALFNNSSFLLLYIGLRHVGLSAAKPFVVAAHQVSVAGRDGVAIDGDEGIGGLAAGDFFGELALEFGQGFSHRGANQVPVGVFGVTFEVGADASGTLANFGDFGLQFGVAHHRLNIAQAFIPFGEFVASERPSLTTGSAPLATLLAPLLLATGTWA